MKTKLRVVNKSLNLQHTCAACIAVMLCYAALIKLTNYQTSKEQMLNQVFPEAIALQLTWLVPVTELVIAIALVVKSTMLKALYAALVLMILFTLYISLTMTGIFGRIPCSCGGILKQMSYTTHLLFNLCFIILAIIGIKTDQRWINHKWLNLKKKGEQPKIG